MKVPKFGKCFTKTIAAWRITIDADASHKKLQLGIEIIYTFVRFQSIMRMLKKYLRKKSEQGYRLVYLETY